MSNLNNDDVEAFLRKHENKGGKAGEFIRSCILVFQLSETMTRKELLKSAQMGYLLDCFPTLKDDEQ